MVLNRKYIIGTHCMFYEVDVVKEFVDSVLQAMEDVENKENVTIDFCFNYTETFESLDTNATSFDDIDKKYMSYVSKLKQAGVTVNYKTIYSESNAIYTHAHYRRDLNYFNCENHDFIIWGESDCLLPKQLFAVLEMVSAYANNNNIHRFITTFATRKMWDESWAILEHAEFEDKEYFETIDPRAWTEPHSIRYTMSIEEMNAINEKSDDFDVRMIQFPKFEGSCLIISSDLIKAGVNIPHGANWMGEDTGFMFTCMQIMRESYVQFVIKNIMKVHNREHPEKRNYVLNKDTNAPGNQQNKGKVYDYYRNRSKYNLQILSNSQERFITFEDMIRSYESAKK